MELVSNGDERAFGQLFHEWRDKLYFFLLRITGSAETAEDILQDTFLKLWIHRDKLTSINNFSGYLYRMIRNSAITGFQRLSLQTLMLADMKRETEVIMASIRFMTVSMAFRLMTGRFRNMIIIL